MKRNWLRGIIGGLSFTSALFIFQACYGTPQDFSPDVMVQGTVKAKSSGEVIKDIKVSVANTSQYDYTDEEGFFAFYTELSNTLTIRFEDIDSDLNGSFVGNDTVLTDIVEHVYLDISMEEK